ncbi:MAG: acyl-CoA mutase large subunit family protein [Chloroflexota bacterium]|nr:acyl-CoA mutase large subunit family protein [Chloroflexota bacterium]MDE2945519.1 acyl-CoA mutase large subunit family protein [Chloroflexota bacterium]
MAEALFADFAPRTYEEWMDAVRQSLPDGAIESLSRRSCEGIDIQPFPQAAGVAGIPHLSSLPGQFPYARGARAGGYHARPWLIAQALRISDPRAYNQALREALANGQTAITIDEDLRLNSAADMRAALADIDLDRFPLYIQSAAAAPEVYERLATALDEEALARLRGCAGYDPLGGLARSGFMPVDAYERMAAHVKSVANRSPHLGSIAVNSAPYHAAGANAVQELALAIATGVTYLRELSEGGVAVDAAAPKLHFFLRISEDFFMEIAKFRAIRLLWAQVLRAFGLSHSSPDIAVHAGSGGRNKARPDAHVNLLRLTTEALSAAIGGVDSICLSAYDEPLGSTNGFSRRISRNLQLILQEELRLLDFIDPAGGAWHVETLTDRLARQAWKRFQIIEAEGGLLACLRSGILQAEIEAVAEERRRSMDAGDTVLVGCNRYRNPDETLPPVQRKPEHRLNDSADEASIRARKLKPLRLAEAFERASGS